MSSSRKLGGQSGEPAWPGQWAGLKQKISAIWQNTKFYLLQAFRGEKLLKSDNTGSVS